MPLGLAFLEGDAKLSNDMLMDLVPIFLSEFALFLRMAGLELRELSLEEICFPLARVEGMLELVWLRTGPLVLIVPRGFLGSR